MYAVDPGDMRTQMHQDAFPGEDISDRPLPEASVPGLLDLIDSELPSGRYRARRACGDARRERVCASQLPPRLEAHEPPEARGLRRDEVRLMVASRHDGSVIHTRFRELPRFLSQGDLLVVNTSATLPAALPGTARGRQRARAALVHPAPHSDDGSWWRLELRLGDSPFRGGAGRRAASSLPEGGSATILAPYAGGAACGSPGSSCPSPSHPYLGRHGTRSATGYVPREWPLDAVPERLRGRARQRRDGQRRPSLHARARHERWWRAASRSAPLTLHTGVSSPEVGEPPYAEPYRVPAPTAELVNAVHGWGGRVIAVGTTVVRALESVARPDGRVAPGEGWTNLVVTPERGVRAVDGLAHRLARAGGLAPRAPASDRRRRAARLSYQSRAGARLPLARVRRQPPDPAVTRPFPRVR